MFFAQSQYKIRCEWGASGLKHLAQEAEAIVIIDVLSFSTCIDVALSRNVTVLPYRWRDDTAKAFAQQHDALLASHQRRFTEGFSLSPTSLLQLPAKAKLVLPSPNGAALTVMAEELSQGQIFSSCLRNAKAVATALNQQFDTILIIAAGERWPDESLRPALEDWLGAGAIIHYLNGTKSSEATAAEQAFLAHFEELEQVIQDCSSGRELIERGFLQDVQLATQLNSSQTIPRLQDQQFKSIY